MERQTGLFAWSRSGSSPVASLIAPACNVKRNAERPDGLAVENATSPTTVGRTTDLIPSAAVTILQC
jgi:hypothetical protein